MEPSPLLGEAAAAMTRGTAEPKPRHREIGVARAICRQLGVPPIPKRSRRTTGFVPLDAAEQDA
jgi:hypothetical protein